MPVPQAEGATGHLVDAVPGDPAWVLVRSSTGATDSAGGAGRLELGARWLAGEAVPWVTAGQ